MSCCEKVGLDTDLLFVTFDNYLFCFCLLDIVLDMEKMLGSTLTKSIGGQDKVISISLEPYKKRYCESGMKKTNEEILRIITKNPKVTQKQLAEKVGLSEVTICSRLKAMKEKGILYCYGKGIGKIWKVVNLEKKHVDKLISIEFVCHGNMLEAFQ